jgi:hypothetical protein
MKTAKERAERALRHAPIMPTAKPAVLTLIETEIIEASRDAILDFVERVNRRAELNMEKTGKLVDTHYAAMQVELGHIE